MFDLMAAEGELAVLAHGFQHIDDCHSVKRVQVEAQLRKLNVSEFAIPSLSG